ncbi:MAG: peptide ABC transporter substrate-binding protein [Gemmatimonadota bacterium]|nr:peptide ABC transporter substrate-binding protein [Gemmatimonadota bacterium]
MRRVLLSAGAIASLAGCGGSERSPGTVVYASGADLESANPLVTVHPLSRQVQRFVLFVTLARYDSALAPMPYAARAWEWSPDRRDLTFHLVPGIRWHDGTPTTAADAVFTIDAARDRDTGYPRFADLADIRLATAADDTTLVVRFTHPQPRFPLVLCELPLVPAHLLRLVPHAQMRRASFNEAPVGNGPFRFAGRRPGQRWVFVRNADFPIALGGPPEIDRLVVTVVDEPTTKFAGLVSGDLDVAGISPSMAALVRRDRGLRVLEYASLLTTGLIFNTARPPFDDVRVRRAIDLALDRGRMIDAALAGFGIPASGPVPPDHPYAVSAGSALDTAAADSLLDAAGWHRSAGGIRARSGRPLAFEMLTVGSGDKAFEQLLQADLGAVGVRMEIRQLEMGAFLAQARARERRFDALFAGIPGDASLAYLSSMYDSHLAGGVLDYGGFHTPRLDSLLAIAQSAPSDSVARGAWGAVQSELAVQIPAVWIYHSRGVQGLSRRLRHVVMDLRGEMVSVARWSVAGPPGSR